MTRSRFMASMVGTIAVCTLTTLATIWIVPASDVAIVATVCSFLFSLSAYAFWDKRNWKNAFPTSWTEWLGVSFVGLVVTFFFAQLDCGWNLTFEDGKLACQATKLGFGVFFTLTTLAMTIISFSSAIRAWLLARWE